DEVSSTLTYLLADEQSRQAVLIDPVTDNIDEYLDFLRHAELNLVYSLETHVHADHITGGGKLKALTTAKTAVSNACGAETADIQLQDHDEIEFGAEKIKVIATPGHTPGSLSFLWRDRLFTGDSLLINGCGRTDFQGGDAGKLYDAITTRLFSLAPETLVYPGHDYNGRRVSSIAQEKLINPRLANKTKAEFVHLMENLNLPKPKLIDIAVPANRKCGVPEPQQG
ncbi:MAG TPA: MBL fold metallo-hydrolase, partial [Methylotenera sp.]|nr:MBL fold metallo-hydrolase [Methylotenera sp.]